MDSSFLYFEKKETPMHIGSVSLFDGEIPFEDFVAMLDANVSTEASGRVNEMVASDASRRLR